MLDKSSAEYKKVKKLYAQGKISEEDYERLIAALDSYEQDEPEVTVSSEEKAKNTIVQLIKELGIKLTTTLKSGWDAANYTVDKLGDTIRGAVRRVVNGFANSLEEGVEEEEAVDPCRSPEQYDIPYEKMYIRLNYIGKKTVEIKTKTKDKAKLLKKCDKIMSTAMSEKLNCLLDESFVGKYECSTDDEYMRLLVRPKKEIKT